MGRTDGPQTQRAIARAIAGAPKAGRPTPTGSTTTTRGQVVGTNADGSMQVKVSGSDKTITADVSYPILDPQTGDIVEVRTDGTRVIVTGLSRPPPSAAGFTNFPTFRGVFGPNGNQVGNIGNTYLEDASPPRLWRKTTQGGNVGWEQVSGGFGVEQGAGSPEGLVPSNPGELYEDVDTGALYLKANGIDSNGWAVLGGEAVDDGTLAGWAHVSTTGIHIDEVHGSAPSFIGMRADRGLPLQPFFAHLTAAMDSSSGASAIVESIGASGEDGGVLLHSKNGGTYGLTISNEDAPLGIYLLDSGGGSSAGIYLNVAGGSDRPISLVNVTAGDIIVDANGGGNLFLRAHAGSGGGSINIESDSDLHLRSDLGHVYIDAYDASEGDIFIGTLGSSNTHVHIEGNQVKIGKTSGTVAVAGSLTFDSVGTVTGSRSDPTGAVIASLLTLLASTGIIGDGTGP